MQNTANNLYFQNELRYRTRYLQAQVLQKNEGLEATQNLHASVARVPIFVEHWGDNLQLYPNFQHWGDEPRPRFFSGKQIKRRPKKKVFTKIGRVFPPNSSDANRIQVIQTQTGVKLLGGWDADVDHSQIIGGMQSNYWGIYLPHPPPPPPPGFRHPCSVEQC